MNNANINKLFSRLEKQNPNPTTELKYKNPFQLLIAVILSAQATDISVNKATKNLFKLAKTPKEMISIGEEKVIENIKSIGLYKNKAKNVINLSKILLEKFNGEVPRSLEELQSLPGVGRKTANVVLNMAFDIPTVAVDTHVFRVSNRTKIAVGKNVNEVELALLKNIPKKYLYHAHHWLILHGRYICKARKPLCDKCPILDLCPFNL